MIFISGLKFKVLNRRNGTFSTWTNYCSFRAWHCSVALVFFKGSIIKKISYWLLMVIPLPTTVVGNIVFITLTSHCNYLQSHLPLLLNLQCNYNSSEHFYKQIWKFFLKLYFYYYYKETETRKEFEESAYIYYISVYCLKNYESWNREMKAQSADMCLALPVIKSFRLAIPELRVSNDHIRKSLAHIYNYIRVNRIKDWG